MIEVEDMRHSEIIALLKEIDYGHLGCSENGQPYIVPVHFAYDEHYIYVYTTEGKKTEIIRSNPHVCLQVEKVHDNRNWKSVLIRGTAAIVDDPAERDKAVELIAEVNPTLTPAVSIRWMDSWVRENIEAILRIAPDTLTGRASVNKSETEKPFVPTAKPFEEI
ncbi:MAG: pyridoxamine 5'-phosphate oxidase family protein [Acidobacteria bacterium]|nr:pyridoxamine 5'-phosphate oxidase family protein [Acidobacteriota bacterium]